MKCNEKNKQNMNRITRKWIVVEDNKKIQNENQKGKGKNEMKPK